MYVLFIEAQLNQRDADGFGWPVVHHSETDEFFLDDMRSITEVFFGFGTVFIDAASFRAGDRFPILQILDDLEIIKVPEEEQSDQSARSFRSE